MPARSLIGTHSASISCSGPKPLPTYLTRYSRLRSKRRYVYADLGVRGPTLPADIEHAARAAGGLQYIESCGLDELVWVKKRFIEDLERRRKSGGVEKLLPTSELGKMLEATAQRLQLPSNPPSESRAENRSALEVLRDLRDSGTRGSTYSRAAERAPLLERPDPEKLRVALRFHGDSLRAFCAKYGLVPPGTNPPFEPQEPRPTAVHGASTVRQPIDLATPEAGA